jgi:hypothetical protein
MFFVVILRKDHPQNNHLQGKPTIVIRLLGKSRMVIYKTEDPVSRYQAEKRRLRSDYQIRDCRAAILLAR